MAVGRYFRIAGGNEMAGMPLHSGFALDQLYLGVTEYKATANTQLRKDRGLLVMLPGSGAGVPLIDAPAAHVLAAVDAGWTVWQIHPDQRGLSGVQPFTGYGNVNSPQHYKFYVSQAWRAFRVTMAAERALKAETGATTANTARKLTLAGHSVGAGSVASMFSLLPAFGEQAGAALVTRLRAVLAGAYCNGMTAGGLGNLRWNDIYRVIEYVAQMLYFVTDPLVMTWGTNDTYAPPDFVNRIRYSLPADSPLYLVGVDGAGHGWWPDFPERFIEFASAAQEGRPPVQAGQPATPGRGF